jgi:hypothetical protein
MAGHRSNKGVASGLATLNASGRIAAGQASQGVAVADQAALTAAASVGVPTKVEFDKVVVDLAAARTTLNALLASLRTAGVLAP